MIPVGRNETLSRFAGILAVPGFQIPELFINYEYM